MRSTSVALLLTAAALGACGPADETARPTAAPEARRSTGVPSAWLEVEGRRTRLAQGSACLRRDDGATVCGDAAALPCPSPGLPEVRVPAGALAAIALDRPPRRLRVALGAEDPVPLPARSPAPWRPPDDAAGLLVVSAEVGEGRIDFRGCLVRQR